MDIYGVLSVLEIGGEIDVVMPIPDSSRPAAMQVAKKLGVDYREGFFKNRNIVEHKHVVDNISKQQSGKQRPLS